MPLYDILNEFQKGHSHMAVVVKYSNKATQQPASTEPEDSKLFWLISFAIKKKASFI